MIERTIVMKEYWICLFITKRSDRFKKIKQLKSHYPSLIDDQVKNEHLMYQRI